jgi:hypothetical protein
MQNRAETFTGSPRALSSCALRQLAVVAAATLVALTPTTAAHAYRPFDGTDADVAETGEFELELGAGYEARHRETSRLDAPTLVLNLGIVRDWEFVVDTKNVVWRRRSGATADQMTDSDVELKTLLRRGCLQEGSGPSLATEFGVLLPSPNGHAVAGGTANFIASQELGPLLLHLNIGGQRDLERELVLESSLIVEWRTPRVRPVMELGVERVLSKATTFTALTGMIWKVNERLALDLAARLAVTRDNSADAAFVAAAPTEELRAGLTWTLPVWHEAEPEAGHDHSQDARTR